MMMFLGYFKIAVQVKLPFFSLIPIFLLQIKMFY